MALPIILAALARVGAGLAARAGASGVARSLVGMSRAAGSSVARRAAAQGAARAAAARGVASGVTAAAEGVAAPPVSQGLAGGARVLENTTLGMAHLVAREAQWPLRFFDNACWTPRHWIEKSDLSKVSSGLIYPTARGKLRALNPNAILATLAGTHGVNRVRS